MRLYEILTEAKLTLFPGTVPFDQIKGTQIIGTEVAKVLEPLGTQVYPIGSSARPKPNKTSNDYDVQIDQVAVEKYFNVSGAAAAKKALEKYLQSKGYDTRVTGITVHYELPIGGAKYQVDVEVVPDAANIHQLHRHDIPDNSPYKGVNKQQLLSKLAKDKGLLYAAWSGLFQRTPENKRGDFITNNVDQIAAAILGTGATARDLGSVESILAKVPDADAVLAQMKTDPNWQELQK
jgi:hypothetical protein